MKFIFHVHSNINLSTALATVDFLKLNYEDVLFLLFRGVGTNVTSVNCIVMDDSLILHNYANLRALKTKSMFLNREKVEIIDSVLDEFLKGDVFTYFCPNTKNPFYQIYLTHEKCVQINYIEDGFDAYLDKNDLLAKFPLKEHYIDRLLSLLMPFFGSTSSTRVKYGRYMYDNYGYSKSRFFHIGKGAFLHSNPNDRFHVPINYKANINSNVCFVFDALVEQEIITHDSLLHYLIRSCSIMKDELKVDTLAVKFHPMQTISLRAELISIMSNFFQVEVIEDSVILENYFIASGGLKVFGFGSSLLIYASLNDTNNVYPLYTMIDKSDYLDTRRPDLWKKTFSKMKNINDIQVIL